MRSLSLYRKENIVGSCEIIFYKKVLNYDTIYLIIYLFIDTLLCEQNNAINFSVACSKSIYWSLVYLNFTSPGPRNTVEVCVPKKHCVKNNFTHARHIY